MMIRTRRVGLTLGAVMLPLLALAAQGPDATQNVDLGGLSFQAPAAWKKVQPKSSMRRAQLNAPAAAGDKEPAELIVFVFPEGAGTVEQNVQRWQNQFKGAGGQAPKVESRKVQGKNVDVTRVEVAGTYTDPFAGKGAQPDYRLLGAIVETRDAAYFLKMVGPEKTMTAARPDFEKLIASITAGEA
jgi:hypothetical protein